MLFDLAGNGPFHDAVGDICDGSVENQSLGYGISAGHGFIWAAAPFVATNRSANMPSWWGDAASNYDVAPTVEYHAQLLSHLIQELHADPARVVLSGFSRGALAVNYVGLHSDAAAVDAARH